MKRILFVVDRRMLAKQSVDDSSRFQTTALPLAILQFPAPAATIHAVVIDTLRNNS